MRRFDCPHCNRRLKHTPRVHTLRTCPAGHAILACKTCRVPVALGLVDTALYAKRKFTRSCAVCRKVEFWLPEYIKSPGGRRVLRKALKKAGV